MPESSSLSKEDKVQRASEALAHKTEQGLLSRKAILYELNIQRGKLTQVEVETNFRDLCRLFNAFLSFVSGTRREPVDVSNAMMLVILSQTFYFVDPQENDGEGEEAEKGAEDGMSKEEGEAAAAVTASKDRDSRIYVKSRICHHALWSDDDFWDQAVYQCVSESLSKSDVLSNYTPAAPRTEGGGQRAAGARDPRWHDLTPEEYSGAAAQVHSVVFAQLGTLSHSMLELGCGVPRACRFVRRLSIRYQLPLSLRMTLIQHLTKERNSTTR